MAKEDKPLEYQRRIHDTKGRAQLIDLGYLGRAHWFRGWRRRLTWLAPLVALAAAAPFVAGLGGGEKAFSNGPMSRAHAIFESNCALCHSRAFAAVGNADCRKCHDGPVHKANAIGEPRCGECHVEHRGKTLLAEVASGHCTGCHANLAAHGKGVRLAANRITAFAAGRHPEFSAARKPDLRPLRLNHAIHMPAQPKSIRGMKLPMACSDCHQTQRGSPTGDLLPVTFEEHCRKCHNRELEFDVYQLQGQAAAPAPHTKDPQAIHRFIDESYRKLAAADPSATQRPLGRDLEPARDGAAWLAAVVKQSEAFLFERKCTYCHEYEKIPGEYPVVAKVNRVRGQYAPETPEGRRWLERARFSHRAHRAVECSSCHRTARSSAKTTDVLIPKLEDCRVCHGSSGTSLDSCGQCHLYHDKSRELDKDRRPVEQLVAGY